MHADITVERVGHGGTIKLDGHDIAKGVRGFTLTAGVGEVTRLELDLALLDMSTVSGEVKVVIPAEAWDLLERMGWTPPTP